MKKITLLFSAIALVSLSFYSCEQSQLDPTDPNATDNVAEKPLNKIDSPDKILYCGEDEVCLWAGQHIDAGSVTVGNDENNLYITVYSKEGFQDVEENLKIWVGTELPSNRPPAGQFPYKTTVLNGETTVTVQVPYSDLGIDPEDECSPQQFYILVHADVIADGKSETAWGGCNEGDGNAWWFYIDYYTQCCECWCGFGNDYKTSDDDACLSMMFEGNSYIFWSNEYDYDALKDGHNLDLLVNPSECDPQDEDGNLTDGFATKVGNVTLKTSMEDGESYIEITYNLDDKYKGYNIQLDAYIGESRKPKVDIPNKIIMTDDTHLLVQHKLAPGETQYTFKVKIPWVEAGTDELYISVHSAIGDCPMPSLQNPM